MSTATFVPTPAHVDLSSLDPADHARATFRAAYGMARRMMRPSSRYTVGARFPWTMDAIRARFGASGYPVAQQAARLAFDRATAGRGATGSVADLQRQGLLGRAGQPVR